jgi:hypothetical protein
MPPKRATEPGAAL